MAELAMVKMTWVMMSSGGGGFCGVVGWLLWWQREEMGSGGAGDMVGCPRVRLVGSEGGDLAADGRTLAENSIEVAMVLGW